MIGKRLRLFERALILAGFPLLCQIIFILVLLQIMHSIQEAEQLEALETNLTMHTQQLVQDCTTKVIFANMMENPIIIADDSTVKLIDEDYQNLLKTAARFPSLHRHVLKLGSILRESLTLSIEQLSMPADREHELYRRRDAAALRLATTGLT
ncbi:MAG TPA: hypothetical protein V6C72_05825, partial [Chroococcales cyanobacterium]